eukprot:8746740-Alexandrium_andersonii.AAC.1
MCIRDSQGRRAGQPHGQREASARGVPRALPWVRCGLGARANQAPLAQPRTQAAHADQGLGRDVQQRDGRPHA